MVGFLRNMLLLCAFTVVIALLLVLLAVLVFTVSQDNQSRDERRQADIARLRKEAEDALAGPGEVVGTLPDGRKMRRYYVRSSAVRFDTVYVVDGVRSSTSNSLGSGKHPSVNVISTIGE